MTILKPKLSRRKIKPAKPIIINKSQVSNFSKTLLSKPKEPLFEGKYSKRLTKKMPRKKIKPIKPVIYNKPYLSDYDTRLIKFKHAFENKYGFNIFKTKVKNSMFSYKQACLTRLFVKGFFEQTLPSKSYF